MNLTNDEKTHTFSPLFISRFLSFKKLPTGCGKLAPQLGVRFGLYGLIKRAMSVEQADTDS